MSSQRDFGTDRVLVPGKLRGFRYFKVSEAPLFKLGGVFHRVRVKESVQSLAHWFTWGAETETATCQLRTGGLLCHPDEVPNKNCTCGFYAAYTIEDLKDAPGTRIRNKTLGVVEASGRIIMGTKGFRAQRMRVVALRGYRLLPTINDVPVYHPEVFVSKFPPDDVSHLVPNRASTNIYFI